MSSDPDPNNSGISTPTLQKRSCATGDARRPRGAWLSNLLDDVSLRHADTPLLACCMVSGLCDSVAFNATGTFASMQTGNTIFLALGAASLPPNMTLLWLRALVSISAFWAGCFVFARARDLRPQSKATLAISFLLQAIFILVTAALAQAHVVPAFAQARLSPTLDHEQEIVRAALEEDPLALLPLALLAFQFGGQIVASRVLGFNEVPTNVLTSLYCDLLSDPLLFARLGKNHKRNRRVIAAVLLVVGGIVGGWLQRTSAGMSAALWIAGGIKMVIAAAWLMWSSREPTSGEKSAGTV
ncbi:hypothetical protein QBC47DRAFT_131728 [Echria macrotheca]|uniref:DUF1275 domain protein n=1 Tax=Echria macrotheca TaxID=438768 RepID=A0AAJ0BGS4_9PEZI|nr:hypothetical protein QBC47DRAFT_131728 [Echria macrotheca]